MKFSVVIPCLNEAKYLGALLDDLVAQTMLPFEVIVADCASRDKTVAVAQTYAKKLPLRVVQATYKSAAGARNTGAAEAKGDYVVFIDADMRLPADMLAAFAAELERSRVDFITPGYTSDGKHRADMILMWLIQRHLRVATAKGKLYAIGGVMCVRRALHRNIGGFTATLNTHDDTDYIEKLRRAKASFSYLRTVVTITSSRRFWGQSTPAALWTLVQENSPLGRHIIQPRLAKRGKGRRYGHF